MTKSELIDVVAEKTNLTKKDIDLVLSATEEAVVAALVGGDKVTISGFGSLEVRSRAAREGKNPQTGEKITIPASKRAAFTAGKKLKDAVR